MNLGDEARPGCNNDNGCCAHGEPAAESAPDMGGKIAPVCLAPDPTWRCGRHNTYTLSQLFTARQLFPTTWYKEHVYVQHSMYVKRKLVPLNLYP
jgi:hypothetical protein